MKKEFYDKLDIIIKRKKNNSMFLISKERYQDFINEVKIVKNKLHKDYNDFKMLANYDVIIVNKKERLIQPKTGENTSVKFYVHTDELFNVLHVMHLLFEHAGKDKMFEEIRTKYCNISKEAIRIYLICCKFCIERV